MVIERYECALCLGPGPLRKSHVLPDFLYRSMYDEKHRFHVYSAKANQKDKLQQSGLWERLLCDACEGRFSVWERYGQRLLEGGEPFKQKRTGDVVRISGVNYNSFRLFQLSILWRAGVSTLPFFSKVRLGAHAERLRMMLLTQSPGSHLRYSCLIFGLSFQGKAMTELVMQPSPQKMGGQRAYSFVFGGFRWIYAVANHDLTGALVEGVLTPGGEMQILMKNALQFRALQDFVDRHQVKEL